MKILLLTQNHVVKEFIELVADRVGAELEVWDRVETVTDSGYDFLFVDDRGVLLEEAQKLLDLLDTYQNVVLYTRPNVLHEQFDVQLKKPFLPSDIQKILDRMPNPKVHQIEDQILNIQAIEEIKNLLEHEGMEIISEEELIDEIDTGLDRQETGEAQNSDSHEKLLEALTAMEPKKIRKLLKGAEVNITIRFPKEDK